MKKIFVDTCVIIDFTKGKDKFLADLLQKQVLGEVELWVNGVVLTEFFTDKNLEDLKKRKKAEDLFKFFTMADIDKEVALRTADLLRGGEVDYLGDGFIAATCLVKCLELMTGNKRHFSKVKGLRVI